MARKAFTLIEVMLGLLLLGLIAITILPTIHYSYNMVVRNNIKIEMMQVGEMAIEKLKAFKETSNEELYLYNIRVGDIIDLFQIEDEYSDTINFNSKQYGIQILKKDKNEKLWQLHVLVSYEKGEQYDEVEYKALLPKK